ncbi:MAG: DUF4156 domain-containing protein [Deltaproteobacteria bacterium]|nr:DUF4156 domain-containing protein [Deltaproteobacteria bacterium]
MKILCFLFAALLFSGCSAVQVRPGAERVRVTNTEPGNECKFLGEATGNQGNFLTGVVTSNKNLETGARNDLKNKAAAMGGNLVVILTQRAGNTRGSDGSGGQTNVTLSGNVYSCPE